jgi:hypothetical protein
MAKWPFCVKGIRPSLFFLNVGRMSTPHAPINIYIHTHTHTHTSIYLLLFYFINLSHLIFFSILFYLDFKKYSLYFLFMATIYKSIG